MINNVVEFAQALSDPVRVQILAMLLQGRSCCCKPEPGEPQEAICVCEIVDHLGLLQSKVSYHLAKLKASGIIIEERRSKWNYYSVDYQKCDELMRDCANFLQRRNS